MEDAKIVEAYWQRQESAIEETRQKYGAYCRSIAYNILSNAEDARECENDTYLAAWNAMPPHRPTVLSTFLGKITRRIALDRWKSANAIKRGGGSVALSLDELSECIGTQSLSERLEARELGQLISRFLRTLPARDRQIFLRRYWYCDSISQIATLFSSGESKIKMNLLRTRKKLQDYLRKEGVVL